MLRRSTGAVASALRGNKCGRQRCCAGNNHSGHFIYDNGQILLQLDSAGDVDQRLLWGSAVDQILADENGSGDVYWLLTDHQNTVRDVVEYDALTDTTTVVNHISYNAFGQITSETNTSVDAFRFRYTGKYIDPLTGLQYNTNRWYNAELGRWMSQDPIGFAAGDENLYRYVGNGHLNGVDPSGLEGAGLGVLPARDPIGSFVDDVSSGVKQDLTRIKDAAGKTIAKVRPHAPAAAMSATAAFGAAIQKT